MQKLFYIFSLMLFLASDPVYAQFSEAQKDSVLSKLAYLSTSYSFSINFRPSDYEPTQKNIYEGLSNTQILAKVTNTYKDASIYKYLCIQEFQGKKNMIQAEDYFRQALQQYENWINTESNDPEPIIEVLDLLLVTKTYNIIEQVVEQGIQKFPNNVLILQKAAMIYIDIFKDFQKAQKVIDNAFLVQPNDVSMVMYQLLLYEYQYMMSLSTATTIPADVDIRVAENALKSNPKGVVYQHFYHFARVNTAYLNVMARFLKEDTSEDNYKKIFTSLTVTQKKHYIEAEKFFKSQLKKQPKARNTLLNSLGFVSMFLGKNKDAKAYFNTYYTESKQLAALEPLILIAFLEKNWAKMEKFIETTITQHNDTKGYASLMSLFDKYNKNEAKKMEVIKRIEGQKTSTEVSQNMVLATWYLKSKNIEKAQTYCQLFTPDTEEVIWRYLALSVLQNNPQQAKKHLDSLLQKKPNDKDVLAVKKILAID